MQRGRRSAEDLTIVPIPSLARPGGNATGFLAPGVTRAAVIRDPAITAGIGQFGAIQAVRRRSGWK